jgi:hypothetical protein
VEGVIQSLVRWKTPEAMRIYARMEPEQYANYVDLATTTDAPAAIPDGLPEYDPEAIMADGEATLAALDDEAKRAAQAARSAKSFHPDKPAAQSKKRRKPNPATGATAGNAPSSTSVERTVFDLGDGIAARDLGPESWDAAGLELRVHNSFWGLEDDDDEDVGFSRAVVAGYIGPYQFGNGASKHTFVIECEGHHYPMRHTSVRDAVICAADKRRINKAGQAPRVMRR